MYTDKLYYAISIYEQLTNEVKRYMTACSDNEKT